MDQLCAGSKQRNRQYDQEQHQQEEEETPAFRVALGQCAGEEHDRQAQWEEPLQVLVHMAGTFLLNFKVRFQQTHRATADDCGSYKSGEVACVDEPFTDEGVIPQPGQGAKQQWERKCKQQREAKRFHSGSKRCAPAQCSGFALCGKQPGEFAAAR